MRALDCVSANRITPTESTEVFTVKSSSSYSLNVPSRDLEAQSKTNVCTRKHHICWKLLVDLPLLLAVAALIGLLELAVIPGHKAGFYCNDPSLSFKFYGDTVTTTVLMLVILVLPIFFFFLTEVTFTSGATSQSHLTTAISNTAWLFRAYAYGLIMNLGVLDVMKAVMGGPRPVFFDLCEPDTAKTCNGSEFVEKFECTSTKHSWWTQMDSYRSFPSGHTSLMVYSALFIAWYLQTRAFNWQHRSILLVPVLQLSIISFAAFTSLSRITDRRHHWWDVLAGVVIAVVTLVYAVTFLCDNFSYAKDKSEEKTEESRKTTRTLLYEEPQIINLP